MDLRKVHGTRGRQPHKAPKPRRAGS
jgi:hypothetical protein